MSEAGSRADICEEPQDGTTACSFLPPGYAGPCAMKYTGGWDTHWALFPSVADGITAARLANRHDIGGYHDVEVHLPNVAPESTKQFDSADEWLME